MPDGNGLGIGATSVDGNTQTFVTLRTPDGTWRQVDAAAFGGGVTSVECTHDA